MAFVINETFRRNATKSANDLTYERGWTVWNEDGGAIIESEIDDVFAAMEGTVSIGAPFPSLGGLVCTEISPVCRDDSEIWDVTASYGVPPAAAPDDFEEFMQQSQNNSPTNPHGPEFSGGGQVVEEYRWKDVRNKPFVNSAGQPFTNLPAIPVNIQVDRVTINEKAPANTARQGRANGKKLLASVTYQGEGHVNTVSGVRTRYYKNTYEVWTHPTTNWAEIEVIDSGILQVVDDKLKNVVDPDTKEPLMQECLLDGSGKALPAKRDPIFIPFRIREEGPLGVPYLAA